jgi:rubrerythrin
MGYRAGENYWTHYSGGRPDSNGKIWIQCDYCQHHWQQRGIKLPKRCPNCGRLLCSSVPS